MDDVTAAKHLVRLLDLTSLNNDDTESRIEKLCAKAQTPYGNVAAVCIYPKFLPLAKSLLDGTSVKLATVVNFPDGGSDLSKVRAETEYALEKGAVEIDAVFPYRNFLASDYQTCADFVALISKITGKKHPSKIILETGVIEKAALISRAAGICIDNGANFIKTSTGKTPVSATPESRQRHSGNRRLRPSQCRFQGERRHQNHRRRKKISGSCQRDHGLEMDKPVQLPHRRQFAARQSDRSNRKRILI